MRKYLAALIAVLGCTASLSAQQPKVLAPHKPIAPRVPKSQEREDLGVPRSMVGGFWMIDANRKASIYLRNGLESSSITVIPKLYLSHGVRYKLSPVTLEASGTAVVRVKDAFRQQGVAPWAPLAGYVEVQYTWAWDPLCVSVTSTDPIHSTIFTYGLQPSVLTDLRFHISKAKLDGMYATEGMWWKPEAGITGFLGLSNITSESIDARVQVSDNENNLLGGLHRPSLTAPYKDRTARSIGAGGRRKYWWSPLSAHRNRRRPAHKWRAGGSVQWILCELTLSLQVQLCARAEGSRDLRRVRLDDGSSRSDDGVS